jgi:exopolysaccharide production protein ExoY
MIGKVPSGFSGHSAPVGEARPRRVMHVLRDAAKRVFDMAVSFILIILALPLFLVVGAIVAMDGGPVFFRHKRVGRGGELFGCWKFRTMIVDAEACLGEYLALHPEAAEEWRHDQKLSFDPRVTPVGRFLRGTSLDELPQLFNVLLGDMSLVGPRPVTKGEMAHYGDVAALYTIVRPGITGLWQVSGRNDIGYRERVALDKRYILNHHLLFDFIILYRTIGVVLSRRGAR